jgi:hypothetical protein
MNPQRSWAAGVGVVLALAACMGARGGGEQVEAIGAPLAELMKRDLSAYVSCDVELTVGPFGTVRTTLDVWARDRQHYRAEDTHSSVVVVTPKEMKLYNAPWGMMLHVPAETVPGLEPKQQGPLALLGLGAPEATLGLLKEFSGELTR